MGGGAADTWDACIRPAAHALKRAPAVGAGAGAAGTLGVDGAPSPGAGSLDLLDLNANGPLRGGAVSIASLESEGDLRGEVAMAGTGIEWPFSACAELSILRPLDRTDSPLIIKSEISLSASR
mmetsp:Transcript_4291/g.14125  ORF Transcript_4291/g.14125 Transcript_4291/m.14125 type:complete len:123 (+) Transcript_4291:414-782(+)